MKLKFCFVLGSKFIQAYQILGLLCFALCVSRNLVVVPMMEEFHVASILKTSDTVPLTGELQGTFRRLFAVPPTSIRHFWEQTDLKEAQGPSPEVCLPHLDIAG